MSSIMAKKKVLKRINAIIAICVVTIALLLLLISCSKPRSKLHPCVESMLTQLSLNDCAVKLAKDYTDINYHLSAPEISLDEIEAYLESLKVEYDIREYTDAFVSENLGINSVSELYDFAKERLSEQEKIQLIVAARKEILERLISCCDFELNNDSVANYSLQIVRSYESEASLYNMSLQDYCNSILEIPYADFFQYCYEEGEQYVKSYLAVGAIGFIELDCSQNEQTSINADIFKAYQQIENQVFDLFITCDENF